MGTLQCCTLRGSKRAEGVKNYVFIKERQTMQKLVALNENGNRIGENHPRAKLLDAEIEMLHELRDAGLTLREIGEKMDLSKGGVWKILNGYRRCQVAARLVRVSVLD
jgi:predicted DNA-binding protein (UPF0251 family)